MKKIGMLVAVELDAVLQKFGTLLEPIHMEGFDVYEYQMEDAHIYVLPSGAGEIPAAAGTQLLISVFQVDVIIKYAVPFISLILIFTAWVIVWFWFGGPHIIGKDWFERGLFNWGYATGTFATGFCLLRVADPDNRSTALSDTAILTPFEHVVEITALTLGPVLLATGAEWTYLGVAVVYGLLWVASIFFLKLWKRRVYKISPTNPKYDPAQAAKYDG